jgi:Single-strand binding protein family
VFRVAVSGRREQEPWFFTVIVWRDQAEHAAQSLAKGSRVMVVGRLQQRSWTAEDGAPIRGRGAGRGAGAEPALGDGDQDYELAAIIIRSTPADNGVARNRRHATFSGTQRSRAWRCS